MPQHIPIKSIDTDDDDKHSQNIAKRKDKNGRNPTVGCKREEKQRSRQIRSPLLILDKTTREGEEVGVIFEKHWNMSRRLDCHHDLNAYHGVGGKKKQKLIRSIALWGSFSVTVPTVESSFDGQVCGGFLKKLAQKSDRTFENNFISFKYK